MKTKILTIAVLTFMVLGLKAQPAINRGIRPANPVQVRRGMEAAKKALNLTDEQKEALKKIRLCMWKELQPLRNAVVESAAHLKTLTSVDKPDMTAINQALDKIGAQKIEIAKTRVKYLLQMRSVLTDEQRMKMQEMKTRLKQMRNRGMIDPVPGFN
jgi:Spy/CpxP family protein refolding chaperone